VGPVDVADLQSAGMLACVPERDLQHLTTLPHLPGSARHPEGLSLLNVSEGCGSGTLDLSFEMLQVAVNGVARAAADDRPQERSREPARSVDAGACDRKEIEPGLVCNALGLDEKPEFERRVEIVARIELLD